MNIPILRLICGINTHTTAISADTEIKYTAVIESLNGIFSFFQSVFLALSQLYNFMTGRLSAKAIIQPVMKGRNAPIIAEQNPATFL